MNGTLSRELKHGNKELAKSFFNQIEEEPVCYTVLPFKPALSLTPKLIGELVALHNSGKLYKSEFFESSTFKEWAALYKGPEDAKKFTVRVTTLLKRMQQEPDQEKVRRMLLSAVYFKGDTANDLQTFLDASGIALGGDEVQQDKKLMIDYADTFFAIVNAKKDASFFLQAEAGAGKCGETALWSVLNLFLYNFETELLDLTMLPENVRKNCLPEFVAFVAKYSNPKVPKFYKSAYKDFLKLVDAIPGVKYYGGKTYEIPGERSENLKILNYLLGTQAPSYQEFAKVLSVPGKRKVTITEPKDKEYGPVVVKINDKKAESVFSGTWIFSKGHIGFVFDKQKEAKTRTTLKEAQKLEIALGSHGRLLRLVSGWLHLLINWGNDSKEYVDELLQRNKVTKVELNELSRGLAGEKCNLLHTAIEQERADLVCYFLDKGSDPNSVNSNGDSPLVLALRTRNVDVIQLLLRAGANPNEQRGESILSYALLQGNKSNVIGISGEYC